MLFQIKSRCSASVLCEVEIVATPNASESTKLGKAVIAAFSAGANLRCANLRCAYLGGADLGGADLRCANLRCANLRCANLRCANLRGADLRCADLGGANLRGAYLGGADLRGANLRDADLGGAYLGGADLGGAYLGGADLGGKVGKVTRFVSAVTRSDGYVFLGFEREDGALGIVAGCQNRTLDSYRGHVQDYDNPSKEAETTAILDFLAARLAAPQWRA